MSGGVDSSATAALLLEQGYEVIGITLKLWPQDCVNRAEDKCCGPQAVTDARAVCHKLDIPYYLIDEAAEFQKHVIQYFADEYKAGRTPNPCVMCNQNLKFGRLIDRADQLGAEFIATGHFARVERARRGRAAGSSRSGNAAAAGRLRSTSRALSAQARTRFEEGPELLSVFAAAGPAGARDVSARRKDQERHARSGAALPAQDRRQGGEHGNLLRAGQQLRRLSPVRRTSCKSIAARSWICTGRCSAITTALSFTPSASAKASASPRPSRFMWSNWMRKTIASSSATIRRSTAMNSPPTAATGIPFDKLTEPIEVTAKIRYNHPGTPATVTPPATAR